MTPEEEMILFSVLQDIADELRRIKRERQTENQEDTPQQKNDDPTSSSFYVTEILYTNQEI